MNHTLNQFLKLLNEEIDLYELLLKILQMEKKAVIHTRFNVVNQSLKEKNKIVSKLERVESQRVELLNILKPGFINSEESLTISKIIDQVEEPYITEFKQCQSELKNLVSQIQVMNNSNRNLYRHSLDIVKSSIRVLRQLTASSPVYCPDGKVGNYSSQGNVLMNEI